MPPVTGTSLERPRWPSKRNRTKLLPVGFLSESDEDQTGVDCCSRANDRAVDVVDQARPFRNEVVSRRRATSYNFIGDRAGGVGNEVGASRS